jgi:hypothetical protein
VWWTRWRLATIPVALIVLNVLAFAIVAQRGGPIEQRYLLVAAGTLLVFAAYAVSQAQRPRFVRAAGIALALACIAYAPFDIGRIVDVRDQVHVSDDVYTDLRSAVQAPATRCALRGHVHVDDVRLRPFIAYWAAVPLRRIDTNPGGSGAVVPLDPVARELSSRSLPANPDASTKAPPLWRVEGACARQ